MLSIISWIHISSVQIFSQFCPRSRSPRITQRIAVDCFQHRLDGPLIRSVFLKPIYAFRKDSKTEWPRELPLRNWQVERLRDQAGCELLRESCPKQLGPAGASDTPRCLGRTEAGRKITSEPWSPMRRGQNRTTKTTPRSGRVSAFKKGLTQPTLLARWESVEEEESRMRR